MQRRHGYFRQHREHPLGGASLDADLPLPPAPRPGNHRSALHLCHFVIATVVQSGIPQHTAFRDWLSSLGVAAEVAVWVHARHLLRGVPWHVRIGVCDCSTFEGHLGCWRFPAVVHEAAANVSV